MKTSVFESGSEGNNSGTDTKNLRKRKLVRRYNSNGTYRDYVISDSASLPDEQGNWEDFDLACDHLNAQGRPLPEDLKGVAMSYTGQLVPPGCLAVCGSPFHPLGLSRSIYIDVDGSVTEHGAICAACIRRRAVFTFAAIAVGVCLLIGLVKGLGWF